MTYNTSLYVICPYHSLKRRKMYRVSILASKRMAARGRVTAYLPEEIQQALEAWAAEESRSISSLATYLLTQAVKEKQAQQRNPKKGDSPS